MKISLNKWIIDLLMKWLDDFREKKCDFFKSIDILRKNKITIEP